VGDCPQKKKGEKGGPEDIERIRKKTLQLKESAGQGPLLLGEEETLEGTDNGKIAELSEGPAPREPNQRKVFGKREDLAMVPYLSRMGKVLHQIKGGNRLVFLRLEG